MTMRYEVLGAMIAKSMLGMLKHEVVADFAHIDAGSIKVFQYTYNPSGIAASSLLQDVKGNVVIRYKLLGDTPSGMHVDSIRAILKRHQKIIAFADKKGDKLNIQSAIAYSGELDIDLVEALAQQIDGNCRARDSQKQRVYRFDNDHDAALGRITPKEARALANRVVADYFIPANKVIFISDLESERKDGVCYTLPFDALVTEPALNVINCRNDARHALSLTTVLHELAHMVVKYEYGNDKALGHGPAFVALYIELLVRYGSLQHVGGNARTLCEHYVKRAQHFKVKVDTHCIRVEGAWYAKAPVTRTKSKRSRAEL